MTDDWMKPNTKPLPGPVASEAFVLTPEERARIAAIAEPITLPAANGSRLAPGGDTDHAPSQLHTGRSDA
ncbi:MAG TPA: hypothetical protein VIN37_02845 [Candidatus Limnocylindria bacterium]